MISTVKNLIETISMSQWKNTGIRESFAGVFYDYEASDGSLVILFRGTNGKCIAHIWKGTTPCTGKVIDLSDHEFEHVKKTLDEHREIPITGDAE